MAFDLAKFLSDDLRLSGDELSAVQTVLAANPARVKALEDATLRQSDYSAKSAALQKQEKALKDADDRLTAEIAAAAQLEAQGRELTTRQKQDLDAAKLRVFKLEQSIQELATAQGVDPKTILGDGPPAVAPAPVTPAIDTSKFVNTDAFGNMSAFQFNLAMELPMIAHEHFELTGERLDTRSLGAEILKRANTKGANADPRSVWEETHGIAEKRTAKATEKYNTEITAAEKRGREAAMSEMALPHGGSPQPVPGRTSRPSPILHRTDDKGNPVKPIATREQPQSRTNAAASAMRQGTYAGAGPGGRLPAAKSA